MTTCAEGLVYVADSYNHRIQVFTPRGRLVALFGAGGEGPGELDRPTDIVVARDRLFIVDFGNHRVNAYVWTQDARGVIREPVRLSPVSDISPWPSNASEEPRNP